jgi:hypothetical protein
MCTQDDNCARRKVKIINQTFSNFIYYYQKYLIVVNPTRGRIEIEYDPDLAGTILRSILNQIQNYILCMLFKQIGDS